MNVLLVGYGYVGQALATRLLDDHHHVVALRRSPLASKRPGMTFVQGDASDRNLLTRIEPTIDQVVCATSPDERSSNAYKNAYPKVVSALLDTFVEARIILVSSTAVYDQTNGDFVSESSEAAATSETAQQVHAAERLLLESNDQKQTNHVVVRASGIYGPGRTRLVSSLLFHDLSDRESSFWTSRIHRDDLADILLFLLGRKDERGVVIASDPTPVQMGQIASWAREHIDPDGLSSGAASTRQRKNRRIVPERLKQLGYQFRYPTFSDGYREILEHQLKRYDEVQ